MKEKIDNHPFVVQSHKDLRYKRFAVLILFQKADYYQCLFSKSCFIAVSLTVYGMMDNNFYSDVSYSNDALGFDGH